jgi:hypothetical protein
VIEGLKKMFENQMKKQFGTDWHHGFYGPDVMRYIEEHVTD